MKRATMTAALGAADLSLEVTRSFEGLAAEWSPLALASRNVFASLEWARLWWAVCGSGARLRIVAGRGPDGGLAALVPLSISRIGPIRVARFVGHGLADQLGPICSPAEEPLAPELLRRSLDAMVPDWDVFLGERLAMTQDWATRLGADVLGGEASPMLPLSSWASWDDYLAALSRKLRLKIRHDERALASRHRLSYRATGDPAELPADLDRFFSLHRARWRDGQSSFEPREEFHRRFAALALDRGWLRLWFLELDDQAVATQYDFAYGGVYSSYNTGRDPEWDKRGVGLVLRAHTIREALASGAAEYRFLRGGELYKQRYLTEDAGLVTIGLARTWRGRRSLSVGRLLGGNPRLRGLLRRVI